MIRIFAALAGGAVIAAALQANVQAAGGWQSHDAPLIVAIAALLAVGIGFASTVWHSGSKVMATVLVLCLLAGEFYWLGINLERELAQRELAAAPRTEAMALRGAAKKRLDDAIAAANAAEMAKLSQASLPGCKAGCVDLLKSASETARQEVMTARAALGTFGTAATNTSLAERMGVQSWKLDLIFAALRSAAVIGGSLIVALAIHPRRVPVPKPKLTARDYVVIENDAADQAPSITSPVSSMDTGVIATRPLAAQSSAPENVEVHPIQNAALDGVPPPKAQPTQSKPLPKASARVTGRKKATAVVPVPVSNAVTPVDQRQHAARFAVETLKPDPEASLPLTALFAAYKDWCANTGQPMLPENVVGRELAQLFQSAGRSISNGSLIGITIRD
jgi:hypothetical protein